MDTVRDLGEVDLWQESLQRSLARRGRLPRSSPELARLRPARDLTDEDFIREYSAYWRMRRDASSKSPLMPALGVGGALALLAATLPSLLGGKSGSTRTERVAYLDQSSASLKRTARPAKPAARPQVSRLVLGAPAHPTVVATETLPPATHTTTTSTSTATQPAAPATTVVASTTQVASTTPEQSTRPAADSRAPVHHTTSVVHKPASPTTHPVVEATVAKSTAPVTHLASDVKTSHSSGHPRSSGGAAPQAPRRATRRPATNTHPATTTHTATNTHSGASHQSVASGGAGIRPTRRSSGTPGGYANPLAHASVTPERIDQGVDYGGTGPLAALGDGRVTYVGTSGTGWPGAFIEFRLSDGPDAGRYVYYAESISPAPGLHVGQRISAGQVIATMSGGIEVGWGAGIGTESYAMQQGQWQSGMDAGNVATPAGKDFSALIASLGGPPGKVEG